MQRFHLGILTNQFDRKEPDFLRAAAKRNDVAITFFDIREFTYSVPPLHNKQLKHLHKIDVFLSRIDISNFQNESYLAAEAFFTYVKQHLKKPISINLETIRRCQDKFLGQAWMTRNGVRTPRSHLFFSRQEALTTIKLYEKSSRLLNPMLIYKPIYGHRGEGMELLKTGIQARNAVARHPIGYGGIYLQEFHEKIGNQDLRIIANEYFVPYVYIRKSVRKDEWKTNCSLGAKRKVVRTMPNELKQMIQKSVKAFGNGYLSIDIGLVKGKKHPYFTQWEAGCCIDFANAHPALIPEGIDIPQSIIEYVWLVHLKHTNRNLFKTELHKIQKKYIFPSVSLKLWIDQYSK